MCRGTNGPVVLFVVFLYAFVPICYADEAVRIGQRWELFVDDYMIDQMKGEV